MVRPVGWANEVVVLGPARPMLFMSGDVLLYHGSACWTVDVGERPKRYPLHWNFPADH